MWLRAGILIVCLSHLQTTKALTTGFINDGRWVCNDLNNTLPNFKAGEWCAEGLFYCPCGGNSGNESMLNINCLYANEAEQGCSRVESMTQLSCQLFRNCEVCGTDVWFPHEACVSCKTGWLGGDCNTDIDECFNVPGNQTLVCEQACINQPGSYTCACHKGYSLAANGHSCVDVDECGLTSHGCEQQCTNSIGSYACSCRKGYQLARDTRTCLDVDECKISNGHCHQECNNTIGSYRCNCYRGYQLLNDTHCIDFDECASKSDICDKECVNKEGHFTCQCPPGYQFGADGYTCFDIDECLKNNGGCEQVCTNTPGHYECSCKDGYVVNATNSSTCSDKDECSFKNGGCDHLCVNTDGNFFCHCRSGYSLQSNGVHCQALVDGRVALQPTESLGYVFVHPFSFNSSLDPSFLSDCKPNTKEISPQQIKLATVVCRSLGFVGGFYLSNDEDIPHEMTTLLKDFRDMNTTRWKRTRAVCTGDEEHLFQCNISSTIKDKDCSTDEQHLVLVSCYHDDEVLPGIKLDDEPSMASLPLIFHRNRWQRIAFYDEISATVACRQLGVSPLFRFAVTINATVMLSCSSLSLWTFKQCSVTEIALVNYSTHSTCNRFVKKTTIVVLPPHLRSHPLADAASAAAAADVGRPTARTGALAPVWNKESQNVIVCEMWTCAGAKVRLMKQALTFPNYEVLIDPYDPSMRSNRLEVSLRKCYSSDICQTLDVVGRGLASFCGCQSQNRGILSFAKVTMTFTSHKNHVILEILLRRTTSCDDVISPANERRISLEIPEEIGDVRFVQFDNSYHEAIIKVPRLEDSNRCLFGHERDQLSRCGMAFVDRLKCLSCGCCWTNNGCYLPKYVAYVGCFDGVQALEENAFDHRKMTVDDISGRRIDTIQSCIEFCDDKESSVAFNGSNCYCGASDWMRPGLKSPTEELRPCMQASNAFAFHSTLRQLHHTCMDVPLETFLGQVYLVSNSPKLVNRPITFVVFVENFWPGFQNLHVTLYAGSDDFRRTIRSNGDTDLPKWTERLKPEFCANATSLCIVAAQYIYRSPGEYTARVQIEDIWARNKRSYYTQVQVLAYGTTAAFFSNAILINDGANLRWSPVEFALLVENPSSDLKVQLRTGDGSSYAMTFLNKHVHVPSWIRMRIADHLDSERTSIAVTRSYFYSHAGIYNAEAVIWDSTLTNATVTTGSTVRIAALDKFVGAVYLLNDGVSFTGYNVTFAFLVERPLRHSTMTVDMRDGTATKELRLELNGNSLPDWAVQRLSWSYSPGSLRQFSVALIRHSFYTVGDYRVQATLTDTLSFNESVTVHSVAQIKSLQSHIGSVVFVNLLQQMVVGDNARLVLCVERPTPHMRLEFDPADEIADKRPVELSRDFNPPAWAKGGVLKNYSGIDAICSSGGVLIVQRYVSWKYSQYRPTVTITDDLMTDVSEMVVVSAQVKIASVHQMVGRVYFFTEKAAGGLDDPSDFLVYLERVSSSIGIRIDPNDGTGPKLVDFTNIQPFNILSVRDSYQPEVPNDILKFFYAALIHRYTRPSKYNVEVTIFNKRMPNVSDSLVLRNVVEINIEMRASLSFGGNSRESKVRFLLGEPFNVSCNVEIDTSNMFMAVKAFSWRVFELDNDDATGKHVVEVTHLLPLDVSRNNQTLDLGNFIFNESVYRFEAMVTTYGYRTYAYFTIVSFVEFMGSRLLAEIDGPPIQKTTIDSMFVLNANKSGDWTVSRNKLHENVRFTWYCLRQKEHLPPDPLEYRRQIKTGGCFRDGVRLETREPIVEFNSRMLAYSTIPVDFQFYLFVSKPGRRTANDTIIIRLQGMTEMPKIIIVCHQNCHNQVNASDVVQLSAYCINCPNGERLNFIWGVQPLTSLAAVQNFDWSRYAPKGYKRHLLEINPGTFTTNRTDDSYIVTVTVMLQETGLSGIATHTLNIGGQQPNQQKTTG